MFVVGHGGQAYFAIPASFLCTPSFMYLLEFLLYISITSKCNKKGTPPG